MTDEKCPSCGRYSSSGNLCLNCEMNKVEAAHFQKMTLRAYPFEGGRL